MFIYKGYNEFINVLITLLLGDGIVVVFPIVYDYVYSSKFFIENMYRYNSLQWIEKQSADYEQQ